MNTTEECKYLDDTLYIKRNFDSYAPFLFHFSFDFRKGFESSECMPKEIVIEDQKDQQNFSERG